MEMTGFWRNLFFSFLRAIFRETWTGTRLHCVRKIGGRSELRGELVRVKPFPLPRLPLGSLRWIYIFFAFFLSGNRPRLEKLRGKWTWTVNVIVRNKSTTIFHGLWPYRPWTLQWNQTPTARGSTCVFWTFWHHFYGRQEYRPCKIVVYLSNRE